MMNKKILNVLLFLVAISALMYVAVGNGDASIVYQGAMFHQKNIVAGNYSNVSGRFLVLNATIFNTTGQIVNVSGLDSLNVTGMATNVTFRFFNSSGYGLANRTAFNDSRNQGYFNASFDTTTLSDGNYSVDMNVSNATNYNMNGTTIYGLVIDNTPPVTVLASTNSTAGVREANVTPVNGELKFTHLTAFNQTLAVNVTDALAGVKNISFSFNNATVQPFNLSAINVSGTWGVIYNFSKLRAGSHVVTVFAFDFAYSLNTTRTYTFTLNTPMNVTLLSITNRSSNTLFTGIAGQNFTIGSTGRPNSTPSQNATFNISIQNSTQYTALDWIVLQFNNASGVDFNVSVLNTDPSSSAQSARLLGAVGDVKDTNYFHISYNVSRLHAGDHTVTVFTNDTLSNVNKTEVFTFNVNTPPNVTSLVGDLNGSSTSRIGGGNFTEEAFNKTFNISVQNSSGFYTGIEGAVPIDTVILMVNTNGTPFNRTATFVNTIGGSSLSGNISYYTVQINLTSMSEGHHNATVFVNDTWGNMNKTVNIEFTVDKSPPKVSVSCSPSSPTSGQTVTCDCTASDNLELTGFNFPDSTTSETITATGSGEKSSDTCTASDKVGHSSTAKGTFTVTSSNGGGGAGGAGGGSSSGVTGQFEKRVWTSINAGETASVAVKNGVVGVTEVSFSVPQVVYGAWVQVTKKESLPKSVARFEGKVYRNLEISKGSSLKDELVKNAKVAFKVEKAWLADQQLPKENVALHHYGDGKWTQLSTAVGEDDGTYVHYTAATPGFSYFVIGEKTGAAVAPAEEAPAAPAEEVSAEVPTEAPAMEKKGLSLTWVLALVAAVVVIAAVAAYFRKRR